MKRILALLVCALLLLSGGAMAENYQVVDLRDETAYAVLDASGQPLSLSVVVRCQVDAGAWQDVGDYTSVASLSGGEISYSEGVARFAKEEAGAFFYQGEMPVEQLPWNIEILYELDGKAISAQELVDATGRVGILLKITANEKANPWFAENMTVQVQLPVDLSRATILDAGSATKVVTGNTATLAFNMLAGQTLDTRVLLDAQDFALDSISISAMRMEMDLSAYAGAMEGVAQLTTASGALSDGMSELATGLETLCAGINELATGLSATTQGAVQLETGAAQYQTGLTQLTEGASQLDEGATAFGEGLAQLAGNGSQLTAGYAQVLDALSAVSVSEEERAQLTAIAASAGTDPVSQQVAGMAQKLLGALDGVEQVKTALGTLNAGLTAYVGGVEQMNEQYAALSTGVQAATGGMTQLKDGMDTLMEGISQLTGGLTALSEGAATMAEQSAAIPQAATQLTEGQVQFTSGIAQMTDMVSEMTGGNDEYVPVSFAAAGRAECASVQFVLRTQPIQKAQEAQSAPVAEAEETVWERIRNIFK